MSYHKALDGKPHDQDRQKPLFQGKPVLGGK